MGADIVVGMANPELVAILKQGAEVWNRWRRSESSRIERHLDLGSQRGVVLRQRVAALELHLRGRAARVRVEHPRLVHDADERVGLARSGTRSKDEVARHRVEGRAGQSPAAERAGGLPALKAIGQPAQVLTETKQRMFAA